jgi:hypothetical protein
VFGLGWLGEYHRRPGTTGFGMAHCWGSPPPGLPNRARWIEGGFFRGFSLHDAAGLGAGRHEETPSLWPRSPCASFAVAVLASFHLLQPR